MLICMQNDRYLNIAFHQGPCNTGESNPVCLRYIVVSIHMLHHVRYELHELYQMCYCLQLYGQDNDLVVNI